MIKKYLWMLPFIVFLAGYSTIHFSFNIAKIEAPSLVGQTTQQALVILSKYKLNPRILDEKEDPDLPDGTILSQTPAAGQKIKPNQSIYLLISKRPHIYNTPNIINKSYIDIKKICDTNNIQAQIYTIPTTYPTNYCFAQFPFSEEQLNKQYLIAYISTKQDVPIIWPDFTNTKISNVLDFLQTYNLYPQIIHRRDHGQNHVCKNCIVLDQNPRAGSLIILDKNKPFRIQLQVN